MQVFLTTLGCRLNEAELAGWSRDFRVRGHRVVSDPNRAQVMVVNTCAVTGEAARKSRKLVNSLHRQNPSASLVLTGCFAELEPERAASVAGVDLLIGNRDKDQLVERVLEELDIATMPGLASGPEGSHVYGHAGRTRGFIKVQDGCRHRCTFCIVTVARGDERSRTIDELVAEVAGLRAAGLQEVVLTGVHLGGYGSDLGCDLHTLVEAILARTDIPRLRLSSLEPWDLPDGFFSLWQNPRLMPHLHLPLQSGSDRVLRQMGRRCSTSAFAALVAEARATIPGLTVTTDVIVGFPGETGSEWAETVDFVRRIGFAHIHIFSYSPRQGTAAARLTGQVSGPDKRERSRQLQGVALDMKRAHLSQFLSQVRPVLWEGRGQDQGDGSCRWSGYTDNYLRVDTIVAAATGLENRITEARLDRIGSGDSVVRDHRESLDLRMLAAVL